MFFLFVTYIKILNYSNKGKFRPMFGDYFLVAEHIFIVIMIVFILAAV